MKPLRAVAVLVFRLAGWCAEMADRIIVKPPSRDGGNSTIL
jgi:hypothetical protein